MTGAAILVAVVVLLVPELLSHPRHASPQLVAAVDEAPIRSYTLSLGDAQPSAATATANSARPDWPPGDGATHAADAAPRVPDGKAQAASRAMRTADDGAKPAAGSSGSVGAAAVATTAGGESAPAPPAAIPSRGAVPPRKSAAGAAGGVSAAGSASAARSASDARGWAVQVGSFSSRENADRLAHRLKLKGYGAFVTESSSRGRNWYRVRVGPQRDRAAADATAARLRAAGLRGAVAQSR